MNITPPAGQPLKGTGTQRTGAVRGADAKVAGPGPVVRAERADRIEISAEGRAQALAEARQNALPAPKGSDRLDEIRARVAAGTYDTAEVAEEVARKLLSSGDLGL